MFSVYTSFSTKGGPPGGGAEACRPHFFLDFWSPKPADYQKNRAKACIPKCIFLYPKPADLNFERPKPADQIFFKAKPAYLTIF